MIRMNDFISVIVMIVFIVIVFRKRIVPFFKGKKKPDKIQSAAVSDSETSVPALHEVSFHVVAFDVTKFSGLDQLSEVISVKLERELINISKKGQVIGVDAVPMSRILLFLIRWNEYSGEGV